VPLSRRLEDRRGAEGFRCGDLAREPEARRPPSLTDVPRVLPAARATLALPAGSRVARSQERRYPRAGTANEEASSVKRHVFALMSRAPIPDVLRRRRVAHTISRRFSPPRPPIAGPDRVAALSATPKDEAFITGNGIAARCRYVVNWDVLRVNE